MPADFAPTHTSREDFEASLRVMPDESMIRAGLLDVTEQLVMAHDPEGYVRWSRFSERFGARPAFAFIPMRRTIALSSYAANMLYPDLPVDAAVNRYVEESVSAFLGTSLFAPIIRACGDELMTFIQVLADSARLLYRPGVIDFQRQGRTRATVAYEGIASEGLRYFATGFWTGCIRHFGGVDPEVSFEALGPLSGESTLGWSAK